MSVPNNPLFHSPLYLAGLLALTLTPAACSNDKENEFVVRRHGRTSDAVVDGSTLPTVGVPAVLESPLPPSPLDAVPPVREPADPGVATVREPADPGVATVREPADSGVATADLGGIPELITQEQVTKAKPITTGVSASDVAGPKDIAGSTYRLALLPAQRRLLMPQLIARSTAQLFNIDALWQPPTSCLVTRVDAQRCASPAEFCLGALEAVNELYCGLGGESRDEASYLGATLTAGDLVIIYRAAATICSMPNPEADASDVNRNLAAAKLGLGFNKTKDFLARSMVTRFLGLAADSPVAVDEINYLARTVFGPTVDASTEKFSGQTAADRGLWNEKFAQACVYLVMHPSLRTY